MNDRQPRPGSPTAREVLTALLVVGALHVALQLPLAIATEWETLYLCGLTQLLYLFPIAQHVWPSAGRQRAALIAVLLVGSVTFLFNAGLLACSHTLRNL